MGEIFLYWVDHADSRIKWESAQRSSDGDPRSPGRRLSEDCASYVFVISITLHIRSQPFGSGAIFRCQRRYCTCNECPLDHAWCLRSTELVRCAYDLGTRNGTTRTQFFAPPVLTFSHLPRRGSCPTPATSNAANSPSTSPPFVRGAWSGSCSGYNHGAFKSGLCICGAVTNWRLLITPGIDMENGSAWNDFNFGSSLHSRMWPS